MTRNERTGSGDPFSRIDYRRVIAWPQRIEREGPFLLKVLEAAPEKSVLDLGCGTGEHSRFLSDAGYRVVGIDRSETMISKAQEHSSSDNPRFVFGDIQTARYVIEGRFEKMDRLFCENTKTRAQHESKPCLWKDRSSG